MSNRRNNLPSRFVRRLGSRHDSNGATNVNYAIGNMNGSDSAQTLTGKDIFSTETYKAVTTDQRKLLDSFDEILAMPKIGIKQSNFAQGTYRITKPGYYILNENIEFNPLHQFPLKSQSDLYPTGKHGAYHLGFFAAITIETSGVVLDLNGYSITHSERHSLLQRFFSIIELANSPFIPKQGPHKFTDAINSASHCLIMNGSLLNSSHHGIHGNLNKDIVMHDLDIHDFEVAGIALNGAKNAVICNSSMIGKNHDIHVLSSFSQVRFSTRALENLKDVDNSAYRNADRELQKAYGEILNGKPQTTFFKNETGQYDGNMYGIVLHVAGVVINDFLKERKPEHINDNITVFNVTIDDIETHPVEIASLPLSVQKNEDDIPAYGGKQMVGVFGDVFDIEKNMDSERKYNPNVLSEIQLYLAEKHSGHGSVNIEQYVIDWSKNSSSLPANQKFLPTGDSMGHIMKGNIGLFISGGKNIRLDTVNIDNVRTNGLSVGTSSLFSDDEKYFQGASVYGILMTATNNNDVFMKNVTIQEVSTSQVKADAKKIENL